MKNIKSLSISLFKLNMIVIAMFLKRIRMDCCFYLEKVYL